MTNNYDNYSNYDMTPETYFSEIKAPTQKRYEALRAFYLEGLSAEEAALKLGYSPQYFKKNTFRILSKSA